MQVEKQEPVTLDKNHIMDQIQLASFKECGWGSFSCEIRQIGTTMPYKLQLSGIVETTWIFSSQYDEKQLVQGFEINDLEFQRVIQELELEVLTMLIQHAKSELQPPKGAEAIWKRIQMCNGIEDLECEFQVTHLLNHESEVPMLFAQLIRNGTNHPSQPNHIWTQYLDRASFDKTQSRATHRKFTAHELLESRHRLRATPVWKFDLLITNNNRIKIKASLDRVYVEEVLTPALQAQPHTQAQPSPHPPCPTAPAPPLQRGPAPVPYDEEADDRETCAMLEQKRGGPPSQRRGKAKRNNNNNRLRAEPRLQQEQSNGDDHDHESRRPAPEDHQRAGQKDSCDVEIIS